MKEPWKIKREEYIKTPGGQMPPSLGSTTREVIIALKNQSAMPGENVVAKALCFGEFDFLQDKLQYLESFRNKDGSYVSTRRDATKEETNQFYDMLHKGQVQIESIVRRGAWGVRPFIDAGKTTKILHQATGKPLHGDLVEDALREDKHVPSEVLKDYPDLMVVYRK